MNVFIAIVAALIIGTGIGWYLKGKFGGKAAADLNAVESTASSISATVKKL